MYASRIPSKSGVFSSVGTPAKSGITASDCPTPDSTATAVVTRTRHGDATPTSKMTKPDAADAERVKVVCRVRPPLPCFAEGRDEQAGALEINTETGGMTLFRPDAPVSQSDFVFDKVLGPSATQHDVYMAGVRDVVDDVMLGFNGTVMAYGQTGAGKTYTLGNTEPTAIGMIPRCVAEIFKQAAGDPFHTFSVSMSYIQIYMELIQDLLKPDSENLMIREDASNGVFIAGVHEVPVTTLEECLHYLELGEKNRTFAFTHLNAHSSRSHAVVMVTVVKSRKYLTAQEKAEIKKSEKDGVVSQKVKVGKLYLVDLAGSERLKKSRSVGLRATEAKSINLSLTSLGMCISARANDEKHVPFRDSKLTRLLQESLGGNAKTTLLVCVADARQHVDESLQSLQFGSRAMCVKNKPVVNERLDYRTLHAELLNQMDRTGDRASELEIAIMRTEEERDALKAALEHEKEHFEAIISALKSEGDQRVAAVGAELMGAKEAVGMEAAKREELEGRVRKVEDDNANMAEVHYQTVTALKSQIKDHLAAQAATAVEHRREAMQAAAELNETQHQLTLSRAHGCALEEENDSLRAELSLLKAAQAQWHVQLTQLHQTMADALPTALPALPPAGIPAAPGSTAHAADLPSDGGSFTSMVSAQQHQQQRSSSLASVVATLGSPQPTGPARAPAPGSAAAAVHALISDSYDNSEAEASPPPHVTPQPPSRQTYDLALDEAVSERFPGTAGGEAPVAPRTPVAALSAGGCGSGLGGEASGVGFPVYSTQSSRASPDTVADTYDSAASHETRGSPSRRGAPGLPRPASGPALALSGATAAVQQRLDAVAAGLMPRLVRAVASLQAANGAQAQAIVGLQGEVAAGAARQMGLMGDVTGLTGDLAGVREELREEKAVCEGLRGEVSQLQSLIARQDDELSSRADQLERLEDQLTHVQQQLAVEAGAHAGFRQLHEDVQTQRREAHAYRMDVRRRTQSAALIQKVFRRWKADRFRAKADMDYQALGELELAHAEAAHAAHLQAAQLGAGMMLDSMSVVRDAVEALLTTFVGRRKELELREQLANRVASAAPMLSHARINTALSCLPTTNNNTGHPPLAPSATSERRMSYSSRAAAMVNAFSGKGGNRQKPPMPSASTATAQHSGPMTLPRAMTLAASYGAVAPTFTEFTLPIASTRASSIASSPAKGGAGLGVSGGGAMTPESLGGYSIAATPSVRSAAATRRGTLEPTGGAAAAAARADGVAAAASGRTSGPVGSSLSVADSLSAAAATLRAAQRPAGSGGTSSVSGPPGRDGGAAKALPSRAATAAGSSGGASGVSHHRVVPFNATEGEVTDEHDPTLKAQAGGAAATYPMTRLAHTTAPSADLIPAARPAVSGPTYTAFSAGAATAFSNPNSPTKEPAGGGSVVSGIGRFPASQSPVKSSAGGAGAGPVVTPTVDVPSVSRGGDEGGPGSPSGLTEDGGESQYTGERASGGTARSLMGALKRAASSFKTAF